MLKISPICCRHFDKKKSMKKYLNFSKAFSLFFTSVLASSILAESPSYAATFASSKGEFNFLNFSQVANDVFTDTDTDTVAIANGGLSNADAIAEAFFDGSLLNASNSSLGFTSGTGQNYFGLAESFATVIGIYNLAEQTTFSFDFNANLNLETSIDNPSKETANAEGNIFFGLFDVETNTLLEFFNLAGNLNTPSGGDFLNLDKSNQVTISNYDNFTINSGGNEESATASVRGSFQRKFTNRTNLALVEFKTNQAKVLVNEPGNFIALLFCGSVIGVVLKRK